MLMRSTQLSWYLAPPAERAEALPQDSHLTFVTEDTFPWETWPLHEHATTYMKRFRRSHECLCITLEGLPAHLSWIARDTLRIDELAVTWNMPVSTRCIYDVVTLPGYRSRGLFRSSLRFLNVEMRKRGAADLWIYVSPENGASIAAIESEGYELRHRSARQSIGCLTLRRNGTLPEAR
jgi:hypothetical protein